MLELVIVEYLLVLMLGLVLDNNNHLLRLVLASEILLVSEFYLGQDNHKDLYKLHLVLEYWLEFLFVW